MLKLTRISDYSLPKLGVFPLSLHPSKGFVAEEGLLLEGPWERLGRK